MRLAWTCYASRDGLDAPWREEWREWRRGADLWRYVLARAYRKRPLLLVAHNIFFDLTVSGFFPFFRSRGWARSFLHERGLTYVLAIRSEERSIRAVSSTNWYSGTLEEMGRAVGVPKLSVDFERCAESELSVYCRRDVEILVRYVLRYIAWVRENNLGRFSLTRASQAFAAYRHRFMPRRIYLTRDPEVVEMETRAYFGGRTEARQLGVIEGGPFVTLDVNSMYPYVMAHYPYPVRLRDYIAPSSPDRVLSHLDHHLCIAEVTVRTDEPVYPYTLEGRTCFPVGRFRAYLCSGSLRYASEHGHLEAVHRVALYEAAPLFEEYVRYFYALRLRAREEGDRLGEQYAKACLNSLYGKLGQYTDTGECWPTEAKPEYVRYEILDAVERVLLVRTRCMGMESETTGREPGPRSMFAIPAHVTDYARLELWEMMRLVGPERVLYCDTDSLKLREVDLARLKRRLDPERLGALKVERRSERLRIYGLKDYIEDGVTVLKGVPRKAREVAPGRYVFESWPGQSTHLRRMLDDTYVVKRTVRDLRRIYRKGRVSPDGAVEPYELDAP
jgi:hypothetical protein